MCEHHGCFRLRYANIVQIKINEFTLFANTLQICSEVVCLLLAVSICGPDLLISPDEFALDFGTSHTGQSAPFQFYGVIRIYEQGKSVSLHLCFPESGVLSLQYPEVRTVILALAHPPCPTSKLPNGFLSFLTVIYSGFTFKLIMNYG